MGGGGRGAGLHCRHTCPRWSPPKASAPLQPQRHHASAGCRHSAQLFLWVRLCVPRVIITPNDAPASHHTSNMKKRLRRARIPRLKLRRRTKGLAAAPRGSCCAEPADASVPWAKPHTGPPQRGYPPRPPWSQQRGQCNRAPGRHAPRARGPSGSQQYCMRGHHPMGPTPLNAFDPTPQTSKSMSCDEEEKID